MRNAILALSCFILQSSFFIEEALPARQAPAVREPAWSPDGRLLAVSLLDALWVMTPDGRDARPLTSPDASSIERDPAWSSGGQLVAFAANVGSGFDLYVVPAKGGPAERITSLRGDERWPSWTRDGRLVFAARESIQWDLYVTGPITRGGAEPVVAQLTATNDDEMQPKVSPDGTRVAFVSNRESDVGDVDLWVMPLAFDRPSPGAPSADRGRDAGVPASQSAGTDVASAPAGERGRSAAPIRVLRARGLDAYPSWAPAGDRVAFYAVREGLGSVWVAPVDPAERADGTAPRARPAASPILVSRHGGTPAWSPDGRSLVIGEVPDPEPAYNGNPRRNADEPPPLFQGDAAYRLWTVAAPLPPDEGARPIAPNAAVPVSRWRGAFDRVWETLRSLYYRDEPAASEWQALRERYRPRADQARDEASVEAVIDDLVADQPLIKPAVVANRAMVVSGQRLASEAGASVLRRGGNVVDAAIAVSFALGVVEPDASGVGGDGMALLYLKGMTEPVVVDYKDQTPMHATTDNPKIFRDGRLVADGPAAANIPGVVAGLEYLFQHYGSGKVAWPELVAPAVGLAEDGFVLDAALPTTLAEGRRALEQYAEAREIYVPGGRVPRPGDRLVNRDYANTLRAIANGGADAFYRGEIARRIASDLAANGGILTYADLAQYRAIARRPVFGRYRGHAIYSSPPPVASGANLIETLQILDGYRPGPSARYTTDAEYFHYLIEAWKVRDPNRRIADPERWAVDLGDHLTPAHAMTLFKRIDPNKASRFASPPETDDDRPRGDERIGRGTTAFAVGDSDGNLIVLTQTLSTWGGNFYVSKGLGFLYNNHLRSNRPIPGAYGQLVPLLRSSSTSVPMIVFREDGGQKVPRLAVGAAGNAWITSSVFNIITNVIDSDMPLQRAVEAPRFLVGRDPADSLGTAARIQIEDRVPRRVLDDLARRGHSFQKIGRKGEVRYGYAAAVLVDVDRHDVQGGAEPRRSHAAVGVTTDAAADVERGQ